MRTPRGRGHLRRIFLALAAAAAAVVMLAGPTSANHSCRVRLAKGDAPGIPTTTTLRARLGETVHLHLHGFDPGVASIQWVVNGEWVKERVPLVRLPEGGTAVVPVRLEPADLGTVTVIPHQAGGGLSPRDCGATQEQPDQRATIAVVGADAPATDSSVERGGGPASDRGHVLLLVASVAAIAALLLPRFKACLR